MSCTTHLTLSTTLWELLPEAAMGKAVEVHHAVVRAGLSRFSGYESATEVGGRFVACDVSLDNGYDRMWVGRGLKSSLEGAWLREAVGSFLLC